MEETKWKHDIKKEGFKMNNSSRKMKKIKMKKDMNFANIEPLININDDKTENEYPEVNETKKDVIEGLGPRPLTAPGLGLDPEDDYDGNDDIDEKTKKDKFYEMSINKKKIADAIESVYENLDSVMTSISTELYNALKGEKITTDADEIKRRMKEKEMEETNQGIDSGVNADIVQGNVTDKEKENKKNDIQVIKRNLYWLLSFLISIPMTYSMYFIMFYREDLKKYDNDKIKEEIINGKATEYCRQDGRVIKDSKGEPVLKNGKKVYFSNPFVSEMEFKNSFCPDQTQDPAIQGFKSIMYYLFLLPVRMISVVHGFITKYIPEFLDGEGGFLGTTFSNNSESMKNYNPANWTIIKMFLNNGTKLGILLIMNTFILYNFIPAFKDYIIGVLTNNIPSNFISSFVFISGLIVSYSFIHESFLMTGLDTFLDETTGYSIEKEKLKQGFRSAAYDAKEKVERVATAAKDEVKRAAFAAKKKVKTTFIGGNEKSDFCKELNTSGYYLTVGYGTAPFYQIFPALLFNIFVFFAILFIVFGLGPIIFIVYFLYLLIKFIIEPLFSWLFGDDYGSQMRKNINILKTILPNEEFDINIKRKIDAPNEADAPIINNTIKTRKTGITTDHLNLVAKMQEQVFDKIGWADGFHYLSRNLSKYILVISFGYVIGLITKDLSKNIINDNVNSNFTMIFTLLGFILTAVGIRSMMLNKPKLDFKQALKYLGSDLIKDDDTYKEGLDILVRKLHEEYSKKNDTDKSGLIKNLFTILDKSSELFEFEGKKYTFTGIINKVSVSTGIINKVSDTDSILKKVSNIIPSSNSSDTINKHDLLIALYTTMIDGCCGDYDLLQTRPNMEHYFPDSESCPKPKTNS